jgi:small subunit ribosomal protein S6
VRPVHERITTRVLKINFQWRKSMSKTVSETSSKNIYEAMIVYKPIMDIDGVESTVLNFEKNMMAPLEGEIIKLDKIGRKRLAYDIRKFRDGFMMLVYFKMPPQNLTEFNRLMHIQEDVLRLMVTRLEDEAHVERLTAPRPMQNDGPSGPGHFGPPGQGPRPRYASQSSGH